MVLTGAMRQNRTPGTELIAKMSLKPELSNKNAKEAVLTTHSKVLKQILEPYTTDEVIAMADNFMLHSSKKTNWAFLDLFCAPRIKTLRFLYVYGEYMPKGTLAK